MHRDVINFCVVTKYVVLRSPWYFRSSCGRTDFLITTSVDGHLKLWKKQETGIEFVKHYRAHLAPVIAVSASADGQLFASVSQDGSAKVFDVVNFGGYSPLIGWPVLMTSCRYDQSDKIGICTALMLLGPPTRTSTRAVGSVSAVLTPMIHLSYPRILRSDSVTGTIRLYDGRGDDKPLETIDKLHRFPVHLMTVRTKTPSLSPNIPFLYSYSLTIATML
jgi:peptidylprolyl isomerase domain and WD repeat-containing protein 1